MPVELSLLLIGQLAVVSNADWSASYEIRADTESKENNLVIVYKATITQNTGEVGIFLSPRTTINTYNQPQSGVECRALNIGNEESESGDTCSFTFSMACF